jgi:hypothetical protein
MNARRCNYASEQTSCPHTETQKNIWKKGMYMCDYIKGDLPRTSHKQASGLPYTPPGQAGNRRTLSFFLVDDARKVIRSRCTYSSLFCNPVLKNYSAKVPCKI